MLTIFDRRVRSTYENFCCFKIITKSCIMKWSFLSITSKINLIRTFGHQKLGEREISQLWFMNFLNKTVNEETYCQRLKLIMNDGNMNCCFILSVQSNIINTMIKKKIDWFQCTIFYCMVQWCPTVLIYDVQIYKKKVYVHIQNFDLIIEEKQVTSIVLSNQSQNANTIPSSSIVCRTKTCCIHYF